MLFGIELTDLIRTIGVIGIMTIIFAESGLLIGFFLPGDTLLFTAGFLASQDAVGMNVHVMILLLAIAAIAGDSVGYMFGRRVGPRIFRKKDSLLFHQENLIKAEKFYERFGPITIVLARFVPVVRTFAPIVAGVANMKYRTFITFNIAGGILWTAGIGYVGYYAGAFFESRGIQIDHLILPIVGLAMLLTVISPLVHIAQNKESRNALLAKLHLRK